jgi:hypothetical protein
MLSLNFAKILRLFVLCWGISAPCLSAQTVQGNVLVHGSGHGVQGALVFLENEQGDRLQGGLTNESGDFIIRAAAPGRYRLRAQRIGFADGISGAFVVGPGDAITQTIVLEERPIDLGEIVVQARRRCMVRPTPGLTLAALWEDAQKALEVTAFTEAERIYGYSVRRYRRTLDASSMRVVRDTSMMSNTVGSASPYASGKLDTLLAEGFIHESDEGVRYFAPDAHVLLSDEFADTYCLRVELQDPDTSGIVGIGFEPNDRAGPPAIQGTLWLDKATYELRWLDFRFARTRLPFAEDPRVGGRVEFEAMPDGTWIVRRWHLRVPANARTRLTAGIQQPSREAMLTQILEEGGEILYTRSGTGIRQIAERGMVEGVVYDSAQAGPLAGARVSLEGTSYSAIADTAGRFRIDEVPEGVYEVSFTHPELQRLNLHATPVSITVDRGGRSHVELALAPAARVDAIMRVCAADADHQEDRTGILVGRVIDELTRTTVAGATLEIFWLHIAGRPDEQRPDEISVAGLLLSQEKVVVESNADGGFLVCGLPRTRQLNVRAIQGDRQSIIVTIGPLHDQPIGEGVVTLPQATVR